MQPFAATVSRTCRRCVPSASAGWTTAAAARAAARWRRSMPPRPPATCWGPNCACGVDLSFTPVLDLDHGPSGVIGDRALHRDPRVVTLLAKSLLHGLQLAGMANCGKHFPATVSCAAIRTSDPRGPARTRGHPRRRCAALRVARHRARSVMPAHVVYPKVDSRPAGFSPRWLGEILRQIGGFAGAVFSDDLSMAGARVLDGAAITYPRPRSRAREPVATWCCCATSRPTEARLSTNCSPDLPGHARKAAGCRTRTPGAPAGAAASDAAAGLGRSDAHSAYQLALERLP